MDSEHCVSVDSEHCVIVDSEHCVSVWIVSTVRGQYVFCQCGQ